MLRYLALPGPDSRWHVAYQAPGGREFTSMLDRPSQATAEAEARRVNAEQERNAALAYVDPDPLNRQIPFGFYTDADAA